MPLRVLVAVTACLCAVGSQAAQAARTAAGVGAPNWLTFHGDPTRLGWSSQETSLTPAGVAGSSFGALWSSPTLDSATVGGVAQAPHIYASPLYVDDLAISAGPYAGKHFGAVIVATGAGYVYAIKAFDVGAASGVAAGTILWRSFLGAPSAGPDGGVALGVLGTPTIDLSSTPPRVYVASAVSDAGGRNWKAFALNLTSGALLPGWPLTINDASLAPVTVNGPAKFQPASAMSQRGGLNLSPDGHILYVPFGAYGDGGTGYLVAVDTQTPRLASAFAGAPSSAPTANGGMWGSGGPAVDASGSVYDTTGNSPNGSGASPGVWGNTLLRWGSGTPLTLTGTYSPWNYCQMDQFDTDLGGSSPMLLPALNPAGTSTPDLVAVGGKQGNAYLIDRDHLPGSLTQRPPCGSDPSADKSLLPPGPQPQFSPPTPGYPTPLRGPLNIFGPYSEDAHNQADFAKARTTPAYFRAADGTSYVFFSGSTKVSFDHREVMPPGLFKLKVATQAGAPAYFAVAAHDSVLSFLTPGSPIVTSNGSANAIVWMLDANLYRTQPLTGAGVAHPVLYAVDASTMKVLWHSGSGVLDVGGKYNSPVVAHGVVMVATDRVQAFGLGSAPPPVTTVDDAVQGTGIDQFQYLGSWFHCTSGCIAGSYNGTVSGTDRSGDYATIRFSGRQIKLYTDERKDRGIAGLSIDGGAEIGVDTYRSADAGDVLVWTSPVLGAGTHTLKIRDTGRRNRASSGTRVSVDRVDVLS